jgi:hypothetical protein
MEQALMPQMVQLVNLIKVTHETGKTGGMIGDSSNPEDPGSSKTPSFQ